ATHRGGLPIGWGHAFSPYTLSHLGLPNLSVPVGVTTASPAPTTKAASAGREHDLAHRPAAVPELERLGGLLQREFGAHQRVELAVGPQRLDLGPLLLQVAGVGHPVLAPAHTDRTLVAEQEPVDLVGGDLAAGETDHEDPPLLPEGPDRIGEAVTADRVHHDVDTPAVGELLGRVLEPVRRDRLRRAGL